MSELDDSVAGLAAEIGEQNARNALLDFQGREFARFLCLAIQLAAITDPDRVREALSSVFGLAAIEETARRANIRAIDALSKSEEAERQLRSLNAAIAEAAQRLDGLHLAIDAEAMRMGKARKYLTWLRDNFAKTRKPK